MQWPRIVPVDVGSMAVFDGFHATIGHEVSPPRNQQSPVESDAALCRRCLRSPRQTSSHWTLIHKKNDLVNEIEWRLNYLFGSYKNLLLSRSFPSTVKKVLVNVGIFHVRIRLWVVQIHNGFSYRQLINLLQSFLVLVCIFISKSFFNNVTI